MFAQWWRDVKVLSTFILQRFPTRTVSASKSHHCANTNVGCNGLRPHGQMTTRTFLLSITISTILSSCTTDINLTDYFDTEKSFTLTVYTLDESKGLTTTEQSEIRPTTEKFNKFVNWCKTNNGDWESSPASVSS